MIHIISTKIQNSLIWTTEVYESSEDVKMSFLYNQIKTP